LEGLYRPAREEEGAVNLAVQSQLAAQQDAWDFHAEESYGLYSFSGEA
jgi:hypothetical protein